jgi:hypothetical protein
MREVWRLGRAIIAAMIKLIRLKMRHDSLQKEVDKHVREQAKKIASERLWADLTPDLLRFLLLAKSVPQSPHPESPGTRPKNTRSKRPPQQQSPEGKA